MPHRYFTNELAAGRAALTGSDAHHLADVMRAKLGEAGSCIETVRGVGYKLEGSK